MHIHTTRQDEVCVELETAAGNAPAASGFGYSPAHFVGGDLAQRDDDFAVVRVDAGFGALDQLAGANARQLNEVKTTLYVI